KSVTASTSALSARRIASASNCWRPSAVVSADRNKLGIRAKRRSTTSLNRLREMTASPSEPAGSPKTVRVCVLAPAPELIGGQARQAELLVRGLREDPRLEVGFIPHAPNFRGPFRALQRIKYVRTVTTTAAYWSLLLARLWRYDVVHVFSASYYSYLLSALP